METTEVDGQICVIIHLAESMEKPFSSFCTGKSFDLPEENDKRPMTLCESCRLKALRMRAAKKDRIFDWTVATDIETAVGEAIGAASVCWENMSGIGVFDSDRAKRIVDELVEYFNSKGPIY